MPEQTNTQDQTVMSDSNEWKGWSVRGFINYFKDIFNQEAQSKDEYVQGSMMVLKSVLPGTDKCSRDNVYCMKHMHFIPSHMTIF